MGITVVMTTYFPDGPVGDARLSYARRSLDSLIQNLACGSGLKLHVADDGSPPCRTSSIYEMMQKATEYWEANSTVTDAHRHGIGASLNEALDYVRDNEAWLYTTDDWELIGHLDLDGPFKLLTDRGYDLIRLGPIHPDLRCITRFDQGVGWWLDLNPQYGGFAFATRPFLATKGFYEKIGPFDVDLNSYETERKYAERVAKSTARLGYWGGVDLAGPWTHLGNECVGYKEIEVTE